MTTYLYQAVSGGRTYSCRTVYGLMDKLPKGFTAVTVVALKVD